ncbi:hypothetical protein AXG93_3544s1120 [Marchantia polymorpha subsp. ruderalis]|uniref:Dirigent protein n=1 Tax=Marchantia polymorpha subsp. ruderalis TaxID=1480154 RepID=A0A176VPR3_MARPO|nr:hypothetical protein AXG93_3544s1120 [Marchantia polymorpha subsp. ruderalis]
MTPDGQADLDNQELAIVGGQGQFRGATGFVKYEKVEKNPQTVYHVTCHIYVPDFFCCDHEIEININELREADAKPCDFHDHGDDRGHDRSFDGHYRREYDKHGVVFPDKVYAALRAPDVTIYIFQTNPLVANAPAVAIYPPGILAPYPVGIPIVTVGDQPIRLTASGQSQSVGSQRVIRLTGDTQDDQAWIQSTGVLDLKISGRNGTMSYSGINSLSTDINIPTAEDLCITSGTEPMSLQAVAPRLVSSVYPAIRQTWNGSCTFATQNCARYIPSWASADKKIADENPSKGPLQAPRNGGVSS